MHSLIRRSRLAQSLARKGISSSFLARSPWANFPDPTASCNLAFPSGKGIKNSVVLQRGVLGTAVEEGLSHLAMEESTLMSMSDNGHAANARQRATSWDTNTIPGSLDGRRGGTAGTTCREEEKLSQDVNRQGRSRNGTKYIYINSLLYNHDKRKKIHTKI